MTAPHFAKKNPLTVTELGRYEITERGPITESLDILAALKASQSRFRRRILRDRISDNNSEFYHDLSRCGQSVFFKHYPDTGERSFAGGFTCKRHWMISSLTIEDQLHAYTVLCASGRSRRLIFSYGCLWGVKLPEGCADFVGDELKFEKYLDVYYRFNASGGCYDFDRERSDPEPQIYDGSQPLRRASRKSSPKRQEFSSHFTADQVSQFVKKYVKLQGNSDEEPF